MEPAVYCRTTIATLREQQGGRLSDPATFQSIVVLSSFGQQELSAREFDTALSLLIERSEWAVQPRMARAARAILEDWQARSAGS